MLTHVGAEESSKSAMYVLAPLLRPLITCKKNAEEFRDARGKGPTGISVDREVLHQRTIFTVRIYTNYLDIHRSYG